MEYFIPLMPLFAALPASIAAVIIARMWFSHRQHSGDLARQVQDLQGQLDELRTEQIELHERLDFSERLLHQLRDHSRLSPPASE